MESTMKFLVLAAVSLCVLHVNALSDDEFRRALQALKILDTESDERREMAKRVDCLALGEECTAVVPHCCGDTQCYWEDGYSAFTKGKCVTCVKSGEKCQRDSQCCGGPPALQCDKGNALWVDGTCEKYRSSGDCYRDGQCVNDCKKAWYDPTGECE